MHFGYNLLALYVLLTEYEHKWNWLSRGVPTTQCISGHPIIEGVIVCLSPLRPLLWSGSRGASTGRDFSRDRTPCPPERTARPRCGGGTRRTWSVSAFPPATVHRSSNGSSLSSSLERRRTAGLCHRRGLSFSVFTEITKTYLLVLDYGRLYTAPPPPPIRRHKEKKLTWFSTAWTICCDAAYA